MKDKTEYGASLWPWACAEHQANGSLKKPKRSSDAQKEKVSLITIHLQM